MVKSRWVTGCLVVLPLLALGACSEEEEEGDNQAPVVEPVTAEMAEDGVLELDLLRHASDPDGDKLELRQITAKTGHLVLAKPGGRITVTPAANFHGELEVLYKVSDKRASTPGKAVITVRPVNDAPQAKVELLTTQEETATPIRLSGEDVDGDALTFDVVEPPAHGVLSGAPPELVYTPAADFFGDEVIRYQVSDGSATSEVAQLVVRVSNVNDAPEAPEQPLAATEDVALVFTLQASDADGDPLSFSIAVPPQHGTLSGAGRILTYLPSANYAGADQLSFQVSDGRLARTVVVPIAVAPVDDAPAAESWTYAGSEDTAVNVRLTGRDVDSTDLSYAVVTPPAHGTLSGAAPNLVYTPHADYAGNDSFTYAATADGLSSAPATITLRLAAVNDPPRPVDQTLTMLEDGSVSFSIGAVDVDSSTLVYFNAALPADGRLTGTTGTSRSYTARANAHGTRTFTFHVSDGLASAYGTITFIITPVNDAPVARADFVATAVNQALDLPVLANDVDVDGDALTIRQVSEPAHGQIAVVGDKLRYTPADGATGTDEVTYQVEDAAGATASATVTVGVGEFPAGAPDEPLPFTVASADSYWSQLALSADGRWVAFSSAQRLVAADDNDREDVYVYERGQRSFRLASATAAGVPGNASSSGAHLSSSGRYVVFESHATNLVAGSTDSVSDVFRKDLVTGEVIQISLSSEGEGGNGDSWDPKISDDGNRVVFSSVAFNFWQGDVNGKDDVFLRDVSAGTTQRLSLSHSGGDSDGASDTPMISGNGAVVTFSSRATNLVEGDSNGHEDVFVRDLATATTTRVSISTNGVQGDAGSSMSWLSRDGRYVSFLSSATTFGDPTSFYVQIYVRDRVNATTIAPGLSMSGWPQLSADGRYLCGEHYSSWEPGLMLHDRFAGASTFFPAYEADALQAVAISGNGRYLAYVHAATGVVHIVPNPR